MCLTSLHLYNLTRCTYWSPKVTKVQQYFSERLRETAINMQYSAMLGAKKEKTSGLV